jgi:hypothetical protein
MRSAAVIAAALTALVAALPAGAQDTSDAEPFDATAFGPDSYVIDHPYLPLTPGTRLIWTGSALEDGERIRRRIVTAVTDLTKEVGGVRALIVLEQDFNDGVLVESELAFRAQDREGNVWHLGEYTELWEEGEFIGGQAWLQGHPDGAQAGVLMPADPQPGQPSFAQGFAPYPFNWTDRGHVVALGERVSEVEGDFEDVLVIEEYDATNPAAGQLKFYAPGVGLVRVGFTGDDQEQERLGLLLFEELDDEAMAAVRDEALQHEARAYVYGSTPPASQVAIAK